MSEGTRKLLIPGGLLLLAVGAWCWFHRSGVASIPARDVIVSAAQEVLSEAHSVRRELVDDLPRQSITVGSQLAVGRLFLTVRFTDGDPADRLPVNLLFEKFSARTPPPTFHTDASGELRVASLPPGDLYVQIPLESRRHRVSIVAGQEARLVLELAVGVVVRGTVVDALGHGVQGAQVVLTRGPRNTVYIVATSGRNGAFRLRSVSSGSMFGAFHDGTAPALFRQVRGKPGAIVELRLVLGTGGGTVLGTVVTPDGSPVPEARVHIEPSRIDSLSLTAGDSGSTARAPPARTDDSGRFSIGGLAAGEHRVIVSTPNHAPFAGMCTVPAGGTHTMDIELVPGAVCVGIVRTATGGLAAGAELLVADGPSELTRRARADDGGRYVLRGLPAAAFVIQGRLRGHGTCRERVVGCTGQTVHCDLVLCVGPRTLEGRVTTEFGELVRDAVIHAEDAEGGRHVARSDRAGRFELPGCPATGGLRVNVRSGGFIVGRFTDIDPGPGGIELQVRALANATIRGVILDANGAACEGASVIPSLRGSTNSPLRRTNEKGEFEFRKVPYGTFHLIVAAPHHARHISEEFSLSSGGTADRGEIRLASGRQLVVTVQREIEASRVRLLLWTATGRLVQSLQAAAVVQRSRLLAPGDYELGIEVDGKERKKRTPFSIRADSDTRLEFTVR